MATFNEDEMMMNMMKDMEREKPTPMPGLTATMEVAGAESIPDARPARIVLGISKED